MEEAGFNTGPRAPEPFPHQKEIERGLPEIEDAEDLIKQMLDKGERPIVTFPRSLLPKVKEFGLTPRKSWIPGFDNVVGTLGIPPYRDDPDRVAVRILISNPTALQPRMTGEDTAFHGVVVFKAPVPRPLLEFLGPDADLNNEAPRYN